MSERVRKIAASLLLAVFALFVGADTLCLHTHVTDQGIVTHSHPYLPSASHTHSSSQFAGIAFVNAMVLNDNGCALSVIFRAPQPVATLSLPALPGKRLPAHISVYPRRGPPEQIV